MAVSLSASIISASDTEHALMLYNYWLLSFFITAKFEITVPYAKRLRYLPVSISLLTGQVRVTVRVVTYDAGLSDTAPGHDIRG